MVSWYHPVSRDSDVRRCAAKCSAQGIGDQWQPHREGHHEPIQYLLVQRGAHLFNNLIWIRQPLQLLSLSLSLNAPLRNEPENLDMIHVRAVPGPFRQNQTPWQEKSTGTSSSTSGFAQSRMIHCLHFPYRSFIF
jgi:hypothetical protein